MSHRVFLCRSHPDFHMPADVEIGVGFDGEAYARRLKEAGADAVVVFGKCHYGHSYYHTKCGTRHPRLRTDMLAETVRGGDKHGLGVIGYYSVFLDSAAVKAHPEWRLQAEGEARTDAGFDSGNFQPLCVNSGYLEELLIPQAIEMVSKYGIAEIFFDTMTGFQPCYCSACREKFGRAIPKSSADADWLEYVKWYSECYDHFYTRTAEMIHRARPGIPVTFNHEWGYKRPRPPVPYIGRLDADLISTGTIAAMHCRYYAGTGLPFGYMTGRFMHGLGDWNSNTPESLLYTAAATAGNGGAFWIIDRQLPDGSMEDRAYDMMREVFGYLQDRRELIEDTRHVPEIAVLCSWSSVMGRKLEYSPDPKLRNERTFAYEGLVRLFVEHGRHFTAMSEEVLNEHLADYRVVIVPEQDFLDDQTKRNLEQFVRAGGQLIFTQSDWDVPVDAEMLALAGVSYDGRRELEYGYMGTTPPLVIHDTKFSKVRPLAGTQTLYEYIAPMSAGEGGKKFGHGFAPPTKPSGEPVVTLRQLGKGRVMYVALPFFKTYFNHQNLYQARLFLELLDRLLPDPLVRIHTKAQVEVCALRQGDDLIVHLVNHSGRERLAGYWYPMTEFIPEIHDIDVAIRHRPGVGEMLVGPTQTPIAWRQDGDSAMVRIGRLHVMESLRAPGYFSEH
jgi:hypothetical protein